MVTLFPVLYQDLTRSVTQFPKLQTLKIWQLAHLYINKDVYFRNVPAKVWSYELGGYPVLKKWLGCRHVTRMVGAPLLLGDVDHFRSMVRRIAALLAMHVTLDGLYERAAGDCFTAEDLGLRA